MIDSIITYINIYTYSDVFFVFKVSKSRKSPKEREAKIEHPVETVETVDLTPEIRADDSPRKVEKLKKKLERNEIRIKKLRSKIKTHQQQSRRLKIKVKQLKTVIRHLKKQNLISENCEEFLSQNFSGIPLSIMKRIVKTKGKSGKGKAYPPELKSFALTLQFYSSKAYDFVRKTFNLALPHQSQIRKWYSVIPAEPGFTEPAFTALKRKVEGNTNKMVCALMLDEMAIKKHISWDGKKFRGYVNLGTDVETDDCTPPAKDALVFMVVGVNGNWKVPCAYFLIDGLSGSERANLITLCIKRLYDIGIEISSM